MRRTASVAVLVVIGCLMLAAPASAAPLLYADEPFTGMSTTPSAWTSGGNTASPPCLTAATSSVPGSIPACSSASDVDGSGVLRLTDNNNQAGFALYNTPLPTAQGIRVEFDMYQWGGTDGDGMALIFVDGSASPTAPGDLGRSLGYSSSELPAPGIVGGFLGVGFDHLGNFSLTGSGAGGPGNQPNHIVLRGSEATDFTYIGAEAADGNLADLTFSRAAALRHVVVMFSAIGEVSVGIDYGSGLISEMTDVDVTVVNGAVPATLKVGFSGGTGGQWNYNEVNNATISAFAPNVSLSGSAVPSTTLGNSADVSLVVSNSPAAGPTTAPITVTSAVPAGLTAASATGSGWLCSIAAGAVTCTRAAALLAGASAPAIHLQLTRTDATVLPVTLTASVSVLDDTDASDDNASVQLTTLAFSGALAATGLDERVLPVGVAALLLGLVILARKRRAQIS